MRRKSKINCVFILIIINVVINSCSTAHLNVTLKNQTEHEIDVYVDTLYLMTMQPNSIERCKIFERLPTTLYIKSPLIAETRLNYFIDSTVGDNKVFHHQYKIEGRVHDSVVSEYIFSINELWPPKDTVLIFLDDKDMKK